jgi:hypothetical protein
MSALFRRQALLDHCPEHLAVVLNDRAHHPPLLPAPSHVALEGIQDVFQPIINIHKGELLLVKVQPENHLKSVRYGIPDLRFP